MAADTTPLPLGYVSRLPDDITALIRTMPVRIDEWVLPSHAQADRVAEGSLDLTFAWIDRSTAQTRGLAVSSGVRRHCTRFGRVPPSRSLRRPSPCWWTSRRRGRRGMPDAREFAADTGARIHEIDDGGITGEAFYAHVRRLRAPVLASPKRHTSAIPPTLSQSPVTDPVPLWTWSLLHRADDDRKAVRQVVESVGAYADSRHWRSAPAGSWWTPADDPHCSVLGA